LTKNDPFVKSTIQKYVGYFLGKYSTLWKYSIFVSILSTSVLVWSLFPKIVISQSQ